MKRSAGVTVIAVLSLIGSAFTLLMGILTATVMLAGPRVGAQTPEISPQFFTVMAIVCLLMYGGLGGWGIATSIGLFRLRNWARISIIVFSVLLILTFVMMGLIAMVMPLPPNPAGTHAVESAMQGARIAMGIFAALIVALGAWWTIFFTRPRVARQFGVSAAPPPPPPEAASPTLPNANIAPSPRRPVGVTVIAWLILVGSVFMILGMFLPIPTVFFTKVITGLAAKLYFAVFAVIALYAGIGLLRLDRTARLVGIGYFLFGFLNAAVFYLAPGAEARMKSLMATWQAIFPLPSYGDPYQTLGPRFFILPGLIGLLIGVGIPLYILLTARSAFERGSAG